MPNFTIPFATAGNYTLSDGDLIEVTGGNAQLKAVPAWVNIDLFVNFEQNINSYNGTAGEVIDSSDNGFGGTYSGAVSTNPAASGKIDQGLVLAANDYIQFGDVLNHDYTDPFSISLWMKSTTTTGIPTFFSKRSGTGYEAWWGGSFLYWILDSVSEGQMYVRTNLTSAQLFNDVWHHLVFTYDGSGNRSGLNIYCDGSLCVLSVGGGASIASTLSNTATFKFCRGINATYNYTGSFDLGMSYSKELTSVDVTDLYNSGAGLLVQKYSTDTPTVVKTAGDTDTISEWAAFTETLGSSNAGSMGHQLSVDGITWLYWDGAAWSSAGSNYNAASTINTNIPTFSTTENAIYVKSFLVSDGSQLAQLDLLTIGYISNVAPLVYAGTNKAGNVGKSGTMFSDCTMSDSDGTIVNVEYKIEGDITNWTDIPIGGYASLQDAARAKTHTFNAIGAFNCELRVTDDGGLTAEDTMIMTITSATVEVPTGGLVTQITVTETSNSITVQNQVTNITVTQG